MADLPVIDLEELRHQHERLRSQRRAFVARCAARQRRESGLAAAVTTGARTAPEPPRIDVAELAAARRRDRRARRDFLVRYVEWVRRTPNVTWSRQQKVLIDGE